MSTITIADIRTKGQAVAKADAYIITSEAWANVPYGKIFARQGDIYLTKLGAVPKDAIAVESYAQLAPGATLGSRHCLDHLDGVRMYHLRQSTALDGPIIETFRPVTITHPKHGDIVDIPAGAVIHVTYQRMYADELRRVVD